MLNDKKHWYDGWIYDLFIAPNQDRIFGIIQSVINKEDKILDVGCGTGRLGFKIANHCHSYTGVDLSSTNIMKAKSNLSRTNHKNLKFLHTDAGKLKESIYDKYDYAVITYVIHEMPENERSNVLAEMKAVAEKIIIVDYLVPHPEGFWGTLNRIVEFLAGTDHNNNFKNFVKNGGLNELVKKNKFTVIKEIKNKPKTSHLLIIE